MLGRIIRKRLIWFHLIKEHKCSIKYRKTEYSPGFITGTNIDPQKYTNLGASTSQD
jgi:hypothetical protein